mmetsp:Transcript_20208/g.48568  ORF Transcript_20208/g.48568 Transcript_20208/m.48568 type:complete len:687 (+) Transcript_20208:1014-3074(+)
MTYDFHGSWNAETGVNAPLYDMDGSPEFSVHGCVENWKRGGGRPDQINIGLPFYGRSFAGGGLTGMGQTHTGYADTITWADDEGSPQYFNIHDKLAQFSTVRDDQTKTQYAYNRQGLVSYDDELAICEKAEYAMDHDLNGYIIWEISGDLLPDLSTPLLDAMNDRLNNPNIPCEPVVGADAGPAEAMVINPAVTSQVSEIAPRPIESQTNKPEKSDLDDTSETAATKPQPNVQPILQQTLTGSEYELGWDLFYPRYDDKGMTIDCRNDENGPGWITTDMMKSSKYECCRAYFFPSWSDDCISNHPFYPNFREQSCVNDGNQPDYMAGDYLADDMWKCCHNFYQHDEELLQQCTGIPSLGCNDCSLTDFLEDYYNAGSIATGATVAASVMAATTRATPFSASLPSSLTPGSSSTQNYCGRNWADANSKCATECSGGIDEECSNGEKCFADCTGCDIASGRGPCGWGSIGSGKCERSGLCCSKYGWCGSGPDYCSVATLTTAGTVPAAVMAVTTTTSPISLGGADLPKRDRDWLQSHNRRRQQWHQTYGKAYVPLKWSNGLKEASMTWAQYLADTDQFYHDPDIGSYGENIALNSGSGGQVTTENILSRWVEDEAYDIYPFHLTQVLWRATDWVGCADAQNGNRHVQVCRYSRPGNCNMGMYGTWQEPTFLDESPCGDEIIEQILPTT